MAKSVCVEGAQFSRLKLLSKVAKCNPKEQQRWLCECQCGKQVTMYQGNLSSGKSKSCGCLRVEVSSAIGKVTGKLYEGHGRTHSQSKTSEYRIWSLLKNRIFNTNSADYENYGGRGLDMDPRWLDFENFKADMGKRPLESLSLDRKDNSSGYWPNNCRWATSTQQNRNRRDNVELTFNGITQCVAAWAVELNINPKTIYSRISYGFSIDKILSPVKLK